MMPHADETIVGANGVSLTRSQITSINLARAVYKQADIYLFDDPLSTTDAIVGKQIFENCIKEFLKDKVCVVVTHQTQYLEGVKHALLMSHGRVEGQGSFTEVMELKGYKEMVKVEYELEEEEEIQQEPEIQWTDKDSQGVNPVKSCSPFISYLKSIRYIAYLVLVGLIFITTQVLITGLDFFITKW